MSQPGYTTVASKVAVSASATKTLLALISGANDIPTITEIGVSFDSTSASAGKAQVQLCQSTQAGTGTSTGGTINQVRGKTRTSQITTQINYTAEPTVLTVVKEWLVDITTGIVIQSPLGREVEPDTSGGTVKAYVIRVIFPATGANASAYAEWDEG